MPTTPVASWSNKRCDPLKNPQGAHPEVLTLTAGTYLAGTIVGEIVGVNEIQTVTITGSPGGGTFTLTYSGQTTAAIPYNATAQQVQDALEALSNIGDEDVVVTGTNPAFTVTFANRLGRTNVAAMTASGAGLTGGTSPAVSIATGTGGSGGTPGTYKAYDPDNTDGSQYPTHILQYGCVVDGSGNVSFGDGSTGTEQGGMSKGVPAWRSGLFSCADLPNLDDTAVARLGRLVGGTVASGRLSVYGN
jgi:hypothetical protein